MKNELGDKCFADTMNVYSKFYPNINMNKEVSLVAEVDGIYFDSKDYPSKKAWLNAIVKRVYKCAMGKLN